MEDVMYSWQHTLGNCSDGVTRGPECTHEPLDKCRTPTTWDRPQCFVRQSLMHVVAVEHAWRQQVVALTSDGASVVVSWAVRPAKSTSDTWKSLYLQVPPQLLQSPELRVLGQQFDQHLDI